MKSDEKRSHRLNYLLKCYLLNPQENEIYRKAKQMGVTDSTAKDYIRTVIIQAQKHILINLVYFSNLELFRCLYRNHSKS